MGETDDRIAASRDDWDELKRISRANIEQREQAADPETLRRERDEAVSDGLALSQSSRAWRYRCEAAEAENARLLGAQRGLVEKWRQRAVYVSYCNEAISKCANELATLSSSSAVKGE